MYGKLALGTVGAIVGAVAGALIWAAVTASTNFQIGFMAVGVGFLAGYGMRFLGGGRERADGVIAGLVALAGCVLGNLLAVVVVLARQDHRSTVQTIDTAIRVLLHPALAGTLLNLSFNVMDLLFYAIAVYTGYRTAMKPPVAPHPALTVEDPAPTTTP